MGAVAYRVMSTSLRGLARALGTDPHDNAAFAAPWQAPTTMPTVRTLNLTTDQMNPMWAKWLDAMGASDPGGTDIKNMSGLPWSDASEDPALSSRVARSKYGKEAIAHANAIAPGFK